MNTAVNHFAKATDARVQQLPVDLIDRSRYQPRDQFDAAALQRLADSMKSNGLIQPIIVRKCGSRYELVAGERRWRAAQLAGWHTIPAIERELTDTAAAETALAENELRVSVNPVATAKAVMRLIEAFGHTQDDVVVILGIDRSSVSNLLRLLTLDADVQGLIGEGEDHISVGHGKVLAGIPKTQQRALAQRVIREHLSVRQLERLVKLCNVPTVAGPHAKDANLVQLELQLSDHSGQRVSVDWHDHGGELKIQFASTDELDGFLQRLGYVAQ